MWGCGSVGEEAASERRLTLHDAPPAWSCTFQQRLPSAGQQKRREDADNFGGGGAGLLTHDPSLALARGVARGKKKMCTDVLVSCLSRTSVACEVRCLSRVFARQELGQIRMLTRLDRCADPTRAMRRSHSAMVPTGSALHSAGSDSTGDSTHSSIDLTPPLAFIHAVGLRHLCQPAGRRPPARGPGGPGLLRAGAGPTRAPRDPGSSRGRAPVRKASALHEVVQHPPCASAG